MTRLSRWARRAAALTAATALSALTLPTAAHAQTVREAQWYLSSLHIHQAQTVSDGAGVEVGVVDTGVAASHPDLAGRVLSGYSFGDAAGSPADEDTDGHGTEMAGIIAAHGDGADHALGIAPGVKILPVRITADRKTIDMNAVGQGIRWATDHGARVINVSVGDNESTPDLVSAVHYAEVHDVVVVGAAGNVSEGASSVVAPARLKGVLNVTGIDQSGAFWYGSAQGKYATLSAPAVKIVGPTSKGHNGYAEGTGTSAAAAIVSGVAALVRARFPRMDSANVINRIIRTATDRGPKGWDQRYGFGIVNPVAALTANVPAVDENPLGGIVADPLASSAPARGASAAASAEKSGTSNGLVIVSLTIGAVAVIALLVIVLVVATRRGNRSARSDTALTGPSTASLSVPAGGDAGGGARSAPWTGPSSSGGPGAPGGGPSLGAPPPPDEHR